MGNEIGIPNSHLGFTSLAATTPNLEKQFFEKLVKVLIDFTSTRQTSTTYGGYNEKILKAEKNLITKDELFSCIKRLDKDAKNSILTPSDSELITQLFILFDSNNTEKLDWKLFITGLSCCLMTCTVREKLEFIFFTIFNNDDEITDEKKEENEISKENKRILKSDLNKILSSINMTAAYLGDKVLKAKEIKSISDDLFLTNQNIMDGSIQGDEIITYLLENQAVSVFLYGKGEAMFGSAEL